MYLPQDLTPSQLYHPSSMPLLQDVPPSSGAQPQLHMFRMLFDTPLYVVPSIAAVQVHACKIDY